MWPKWRPNQWPNRKGAAHISHQTSRVTDVVQISRILARLAALILPLGLLPTPGSGQGLRSFTVAADNDGFVFWTPPDQRTDWYYTHGLRAEAVVAWAPPGVGFLGAGDPVLCPPDPTADPCIVTRITFGQAIYTPAMLFSSTPRGMTVPMPDGCSPKPQRPGCPRTGGPVWGCRWD